MCAQHVPFEFGYFDFTAVHVGVKSCGKIKAAVGDARELLAHGQLEGIEDLRKVLAGDGKLPICAGPLVLDFGRRELAVNLGSEPADAQARDRSDLFIQIDVDVRPGLNAGLATREMGAAQVGFEGQRRNDVVFVIQIVGHGGGEIGVGVKRRLVRDSG